MRWLAGVLYRITGNRLTPNMVTTVGALAYIPIAYLIVQGDFALAGVLHLVFGSLDMIDGELARLTKKANQFGALYDASTDRIKIGLLFAGVAGWMAANGHAEQVYVPLMAAVLSATVAYVKAKGEVGVALQKRGLDHHQINHVFVEGLVPFDFLNIYVAVGLFSGRVVEMSWAVLVLSGATYFWLLVRVNDELE